MNKLLNIILSGLLWRRYKFLLVSLIVLIAFIFLSGQVHQDYLAYAQTNQNISVGWSFALKWLAWTIAVVLFFLLNNWHNNKKRLQADAEDKNSTLQRILKWKLTHPKDSAQQSAKQDDSGRNKADGGENDPFAHLREKPKLRSYADMIIEKKHGQAKEGKQK